MPCYKKKGKDAKSKTPAKPPEDTVQEIHQRMTVAVAEILANQIEATYPPALGYDDYLNSLSKKEHEKNERHYCAYARIITRGDWALVVKDRPSSRARSIPP
jgi:hypothetical protein